jgi:hypothetical protein
LASIDDLADNGVTEAALVLNVIACDLSSKNFDFISALAERLFSTINLLLVLSIVA